MQIFKPLSLFLGLRYVRARKRTHFISFISMVSMLGIGLGVMVLITVLSVMNGFDQQIKTRILSMVPQITVSSLSGTVSADPQNPLKNLLERYPGVTAVAPTIQGEALISNSGATVFSLIEGIDPNAQRQVSPIGEKIISGRLSSLTPNRFGIVLGVDLANQLGVGIGDTLTLLVPRGNLSPFGFTPVMRQFTVVGIFKTGYQFDSNMALINISDAQRLLNMEGIYSGWQLKCHDLFQAPSIAHQLNQALGGAYQAQDWTAQNQNFFAALSMEKTMMFLILTLIIAIAVFNMLASLVMLVIDKQAEIAILRTLGFQTGQLMRVFIIQGMIIGVIGITIGTGLGIALSLSITSIVNHLQALLGVQFLNSSVYYIDFLPSQLRFADIWHVDILAVGLSFLATLYPAFKASQVQPAQALRYE